MMSSRQWAQIRAMDEALVLNSTKAGQVALNGTRRPQLGVLPATRSNPQGVGMARVAPRLVQNPLTTLTTQGQSRANLMRKASGVRINKNSVSPTSKWVPLKDCVRMVGILPVENE